VCIQKSFPIKKYHNFYCNHQTIKLFFSLDPFSPPYTSPFIHPISFFSFLLLPPHRTRTQFFFPSLFLRLSVSSFSPRPFFRRYLSRYLLFLCFSCSLFFFSSSSPFQPTLCSLLLFSLYLFILFIFSFNKSIYFWF
jgi:hypothetical protein